MAICYQCGSCGHSWYDWRPGAPKTGAVRCIYCQKAEEGNAKVIFESAEPKEESCPELGREEILWLLSQCDKLAADPEDGGRALGCARKLRAMAAHKPEGKG